MFHPEALQHLLSTVPADVWGRLDTNPLLLRCASRTLQRLVDGMRPCLPAAISLSPEWWFQYPGPGPAKWATVLQELMAISARTRVISLRLFSTARLHGLAPVLQLCDLQLFSIHSNGNMGAKGAAALALALRTSTGMTHLNLRRNDVRVEGIVRLSPALLNFHGLRYLDLGLNVLDDRGVTALAPVLVVCTALQTLNLSGNQCQAGGTIALAAFVPRYSALTHLDVGRNHLQNLGTEDLAHALAHCRRLAHLDFSNNRCCPGPFCCMQACTNAGQRRCTNFDALADALGAFVAVAHLDVSQNELSRHGVQHLAARLRHGTALHSLELVNCVRESHNNSLGAGLGSCSRLAVLRLNYNTIQCHAAGAYARALELCPGLVLLDLTGNDIFNHGAQELARSLARLHALAKLLLPFNNIGILGAAALLEQSSL
jgi:Ran GTPase-activating protein (RanGAP) involved in mRNA processing and transport